MMSGRIIPGMHAREHRQLGCAISEMCLDVRPRVGEIYFDVMMERAQ